MQDYDTGTADCKAIQFVQEMGGCNLFVDGFPSGGSGWIRVDGDAGAGAGRCPNDQDGVPMVLLKMRYTTTSTAGADR